jgi:hypothetical protein
MVLDPVCVPMSRDGQGEFQLGGPQMHEKLLLLTSRPWFLMSLVSSRIIASPIPVVRGTG